MRSIFVSKVRVAMLRMSGFRIASDRTGFKREFQIQVNVSNDSMATPFPGDYSPRMKATKF
mgnify:CR=1 FL=1